jgi:hypothetical protein
LRVFLWTGLLDLPRLLQLALAHSSGL